MDAGKHARAAIIAIKCFYEMHVHIYAYMHMFVCIVAYATVTCVCQSEFPETLILRFESRNCQTNSYAELASRILSLFIYLSIYLFCVPLVGTLSRDVRRLLGFLFRTISEFDICVSNSVECNLTWKCICRNSNPVSCQDLAQVSLLICSSDSNF